MYFMFRFNFTDIILWVDMFGYEVGVHKVGTGDFSIPPPYVPTRNALKAVLIITLFFSTFLAGIAAFFLRQFVAARNDSFFSNIFSFVSVFGAGVFLATCLLDLLPESLECFEKADEIMKWFNGFPFPELCIAAGFLLVLIVEQAILYANEKRWIGDAETGGFLNNHGEAPSYNRNNDATDHSQNTESSDTAHGHPPQLHNRMENVEAQPLEGMADPEDVSSYAPLVDSENVNSSLTEHPHSAIRVLLLVFALSLHAVFEGLSLGMITEVSVLLQIFFALFIHKSIIGFSLGVRVVQSKLSRVMAVLCCMIFAGQIIIGGFLGVAVVDIMNKTSRTMSNFISGILQSIACGTFLYITCFEVLPHELNNSTHRPAKIFFLLMGFLLIVAFAAVFQV